MTNPNFQEKAEIILKLAKKSGADAAEIFISQSKNTDVTICDQDVETATRSSTQGFGLKYLKDHKKIFVDSSDFSDIAIKETIDKASQLVTYADEDPHNVIAPKLDRRRYVNLNDTTLGHIPFDQKVEYLKKIEQKSLSFNEKIKQVIGISYNESINTILIANTGGLLCSYPVSYIEVGATVLATDGEERQEGEASRKVNFFKDLPEPDVFVNEACSMACDLIGGKPVNTKVVPVVFDPGATWIIIRYGIFEAVRGDKILKKSSFLDGKIGQQIASPLVTIIDDGTLDRGLKSVPCDDEGTPTMRKIIVDRGQLKMYIYDLYSAHQAETQPTGNAFRRSYRSTPEIGNTNLFLEKGDVDPTEIIAGVEDGLWVKNTIGFGVDSVSGNYSVGASGRWIRKGKLAEPVGGITIACSLDELLNGIDAIGNDLVFRHAITTPTFRVKSMTVSGTDGKG